jgi:hypothetical protein
LPIEDCSEEQRQLDRTHLQRLIRPKGVAKEVVIVMGAGSVHLRKGVDLFIDCAARVIREPNGKQCRFVWFGNGYDVEKDVGYSVYLADQIRRAGLEEHVCFIGETSAIETAYEEADLLMLSSRLDPLPNVAIDAMVHGVPVVCFDKTTGIADFLSASGLQEHCVAEYLDTADMAEKILTLAGSPGLRFEVAENSRAAAINYFDMKNYVARLVELTREVFNRTQQEKLDTQTILASSLFRLDFVCRLQRQPLSIETAVREYVRGWASGVDHRKPFPGFHPGIYLEQSGNVAQGVNPFADYLRRGQPAGPWVYPVISSSKTDSQELPSGQRVALHLHVYYLDLLPDILERLSRNTICPDLFISVSTEDAREQVKADMRDYRGRIIEIQLVPNRGRDIGPFFTAFGQRLLDEYDFIGHVHTKKSVEVKDFAMGRDWYRFLLENLLGGESGSMVDTIIAKMHADSSIGMVFPDDPHVLGLGGNRVQSQKLAARIGMGALPEHFNFPVGSMFWARTDALLPLMRLKLGWDDYPEEPLPYDGSELHAIERLFSLSLLNTSRHVAATNVVGITR